MVSSSGCDNRSVKTSLIFRVYRTQRDVFVYSEVAKSQCETHRGSD